MTDHPDINDKAQSLIKTLVERYISEGQPVGSKTLSEASGLSVSPATVRNIMVDLEAKGYVASPHTSAGRVPTAQAYRLFVDSLLQIEPLRGYDLETLRAKLDPDMTSQELVESASGLLSEITQMAGLVTIPKRDHVMLRHVEFLPLEGNRVLVILVLDDHEVQNRIIYTEQAYSEGQLKEASNFVNASFPGQSLTNVRAEVLTSMKDDRESMNSLMQATLEVAEKAFTTTEMADRPDYVLAGQENLLGHYRAEAFENLRELFRAFSVKGDILHLLDRCMESQGVQLFIGQESGYELLDDCSLVTAPYTHDGESVGVLGVIGPTRMAYDRIIPVVGATARLLSAAFDSGRGRD
ncbi:MAG: heat-inducible transcriptional repressor HrcA [Gammaproteobacteria bacterium]|nr:heat-inducible transcriptional repressor HrcA [Gammaproteobacteria bacterium]